MQKLITDEQKKKLSLIHKLAYKNGRVHPLKGKHHSEATKEKMRVRKIGHIPWNKGKKMSKEYSEIMRKAQLGSKHYEIRDEKHHGWKGDLVSRAALHIWVKRRKTKPEFCEECGLKSPRDLANISQTYKRDVNDYEWLCRMCHMTKDGRREIARERMRHLNKHV